MSSTTVQHNRDITRLGLQTIVPAIPEKGETFTLTSVATLIKIPLESKIQQSRHQSP